MQHELAQQCNVKARRISSARSSNDAVAFDVPLHGCALAVLLCPAFFVALSSPLLCFLLEFIPVHCQSCVEIGDFLELVFVALSFEVAEAVAYFFDRCASYFAGLASRD